MNWLVGFLPSTMPLFFVAPESPANLLEESQHDFQAHCPLSTWNLWSFSGANKPHCNRIELKIESKFPTVDGRNPAPSDR